MALPGSLDRMMLRSPERALNRSIRESTAARDLCAALAGETLAIEVLGLGLTLGISARSSGVELMSEPRSAGVTVRGTPLDLLRLVGADPAAALRATRTEVSGQLELAQRFADLLRLARPDFEREAARWLGDWPSHELARAFGAARRWVFDTVAALERCTVEYLQEEARELPALLEAEAHGLEVERLRDDVERLAARIERLERSRAGRA